MGIHVLVRTTPPCGYCVKTKALLDMKGLAYTTEDHETPERVEAFKNAGHRSFPRVFIDDELIGGFDELQAHLQDKSSGDDDF
ncbi:glutaredoxin [Rhizobium phage RHEph10]|uniref:glutaredoxin n=1 Tax=Rhizobium phage RHEph10 TaxID=1220717 RepID=UPI0002AAFCFE|nr:glutaredoxin [Rhizobium phage RHEph10]AGC36116.1 putative glutaredoxin protein [Rhizobium phage RHEph10]